MVTILSDLCAVPVARFFTMLAVSILLVAGFDDGCWAQSDSASPETPQQNVDELTNEELADGQSDLDKAFELKLSVSSTRDLDKIADLCESAIAKGLDDESKEQALELWAGVLMEHAQELDRRIAPNGVLSTRWRWLRQQAISRLEKAVELRPQLVDALMMLARLHSMPAGDREAAMQAIEKAIAQISGDREQLSEALRIRSRLQDDEQGRIADLTQAVKINPRNVDALLERALYYLGEGTTDEAMDDFRSLLAVDKENIDRYILISEQLRQTGLFKESVAILDLAIDADDQSEVLYVLRGRAHLVTENNQAALADLNKALEINHQNLDALNFRTRVLLMTQDYDRALADANELIQQAPDQTVGYELRSLVYRSQRQLEKAIEDVQAILKMKPRDLDLQFDLAILYSANEQPSKAIPIFDGLVKRAKSSQILRQRGDAYLSQGKHEAAIQDYEEALELIAAEEDERDSTEMTDREKDAKSGLLNNLAWLLATSPLDELRDGKRSIELAIEASELTDYKAAHILSTLASGYAEIGEFETARKWAANAVEAAESDEQRQGLQEELDSYLKDQPWRELENVEDKKKDPEQEADADKSENDTESAPDAESENNPEPDEAKPSSDPEHEDNSADDGKPIDRSTSP